PQQSVARVAHARRGMAQQSPSLLRRCAPGLPLVGDRHHLLRAPRAPGRGSGVGDPRAARTRDRGTDGDARGGLGHWRRARGARSLRRAQVYCAAFLGVARMRTGLLRGREHLLLGAVAALAERRVAIALSRGGASKNYSHRDPNEDACAFAWTDHAWL